MKILFVTPHLSTGGLPQYLLKQVEIFSKEHEIFVIEYSDIAPDFIVQKNKLKSILGNNLITLRENKQDIIKYISQINPEVVHFQELPEDFIEVKILDEVYKYNRKYSIVVTTHSSYTDPSRIKYTADKFVLVSNWSKKVFENHYKDEIPCDVLEYPIEKIEYNKEEAKKELGWDPEYKHVLHVGLFTPGKNQKHIMEVAKLCLDYKIQFHFIGNQAGNFADYWKPLMKKLPKNCIWHGERNDVERFYKAADLFYFPSLFELSPISIKEAISHNLPLFLTKLHTYESDYDGKAIYVTSDVNDAKNKLIKFFNLKKTKEDLLLYNIKTFHILTDIDTEREIRSMSDLTKLEDFGIQYNPVISKRYTELPPAETCAFPEIISMEPGGHLTPAHYGCYLGHRKAFESGIETDADFIFICECDCGINLPPKEFTEIIKLACDICLKDDLLVFTLGSFVNENILEEKENYYLIDQIIGAHAYIIPKKSFKFFEKIYQEEKWNVADLFISNNIRGQKIGTFKKPYTKQYAGYSILEKKQNEDRY
jgi:glycosyltransferase involved in cell wall biosynthesis